MHDGHDSYYEPLSNDPFPGSRLSYHVERPPFEYPDPNPLAPMRLAPGPRMRIVIEGETGFVERLSVVMAAEMAAIKAEIDTPY